VSRGASRKHWKPTEKSGSALALALAPAQVQAPASRLHLPTGRGSLAVRKRRLRWALAALLQRDPKYRTGPARATQRERTSRVRKHFASAGAAESGRIPAPARFGLPLRAGASSARTLVTRENRRPASRTAQTELRRQQAPRHRSRQELSASCRKYCDAHGRGADQRPVAVPNATTRFLPSRLAAYNARSAATINSSAVLACGNAATPKLAVT
jgi:hypothetical protein